MSTRSHLLEVLQESDQGKRLDLTFKYAAIDHGEMIRVHPFSDGNGRWARIATNAFLFDAGCPVGTIIRKNDKLAYIAALDRCMDKGAPGDLANLFLDGYLAAMRKRLM